MGRKDTTRRTHKGKSTMARGWTKNRIYDFMHKSVVGTCMAVTAIGTVYLGYRGLMYIMYTMPQRKELRRRMLEQKLEDEQNMKDQELLLQQKDSEILKT